MLGSDYAQNISFRYTGGLYSYGFMDALADHMAVVGTLLLAVAVVIVLLLIRDTRRKKEELKEKEAARLVLEEKTMSSPRARRLCLERWPQRSTPTALRRSFSIICLMTYAHL